MAICSPALHAEAGAEGKARPLRPALLKSGVMAADAAATAVGMGAAFILTRHFDRLNAGVGRACLLIGAVMLPVWLIMFGRCRLYNARCVSIRRTEMGRLTHATLAGTVVMTGLAFLTKAPLPRSFLLLCFLAVLVSCGIEREVVRATFGRMRNSGRLLRRVVLVGANDEAESICEQTSQFPALGYQVVGVVDDGSVRRLGGHEVVGRVEDTLETVRATGATGVIVATTAVTAASANRLVRELTDAGVHVEMSSSLRDIDAERLVVRKLGSCPMLYIEPVRRGGWRAVAKRTFDLVCSGVALTVLAPFYALVALAIMIDSPGGVFFSQVRVGKDGRPFSVHKFRTMTADAESQLAGLLDRNEADGPLFKLSHDPRVTGAGKYLRKFSVDELPQLWNVFCGEMSLVGPRPALYSEMDGWTLALQQTRLRVPPGLTGMWQVSGRSSLSFSEYVRLDLYYVDNWSLWRDLAILAKTVPMVLTQHGAY